MMSADPFSTVQEREQPLPSAGTGTADRPSVEDSAVITKVPPGNRSGSPLVVQQPADPHPVELYLARRTPRSRQEARDVLETIAALLTEGRGTAATLGWHLLTGEHLGNVRAVLTQRHPAADANRMLAALRGVLKECWHLRLMSAEDYQRVRAALEAGGPALQGRSPSRSELRSVFESFVEDGSPPPSGRGGAVRTLLHGTEGKQDKATSRVGAPHAASAVRGNAMMMEQLHLRKVPPREAIAHALWEAGVCLRSSAFCACLAMLRKALILWSAEYGEKHGTGPDRGVVETDDLAGRLGKIAEENKLYRETIHTILGSLQNDVHDGPGAMVCRGGYASSYDGLAVTRIKTSYRNLHEMIVILITSTTPDLPL